VQPTLELAACQNLGLGRPESCAFFLGAPFNAGAGELLA